MLTGIVNLRPNLDPSPTVHTSSWDHGRLPCLPCQPIVDTHPCLKNLAASHHHHDYSMIQARILSPLTGFSALAWSLWVCSQNSSWRDAFNTYCFLSPVSHLSAGISPQLHILPPHGSPSLLILLYYLHSIDRYIAFIHLVPSSADMRAMSCACCIPNIWNGCAQLLVGA